MPSIIGTVATGSSGNTESSLTVSHTLVSGKNRKVIVISWLWYSDHTNPRGVTSCTYNGVAMSSIVLASNSDETYAAVYVRMWEMYEADLPADGAHNVVQSTTAPQDYRTMHMVVLALENATQLTAEDTGSITGNTTSLSTTLTPITVNAMMISGGICDSNVARTLTGGTGQTSLYGWSVDGDSGGSWWELAASSSEAQSFTIGGSDRSALVAASFKHQPPSAGAIWFT